MEYAIDMRGVTKQYQGFCLNHVDFQVPKGSVVGLIGENGAGKTTLIKAALGLISVEEGSICIQGISTIEEDLKWKEDIGVVFDDSGLPEALKISQIQKLMPSFFKSWEKDTFSELVRRFGLPEDKKIKDYSKGMRMKLSIAIALSHKAKLLLLDEATGGLDPVVRDEILEMLMEFMQDEDHSILISSHITSDIEKIADFIAFIRNGELLFMKNKDELLYNYGILKCGEKDLEQIDTSYFVSERKGAFQCEVLINNRHEFQQHYPDYIVDPASIESIMLFLIKGDRI